MRSTWFEIVGGFVLAAAAALPLAAQQSGYTSAESPYQGDIAYTVGATAEPKVDVAGARWNLLQIEPLAEAPYQSGRQVKVRVNLGFEGVGTSSVRVEVVLLLEDKDGNMLDRIECKPFRVRPERSRVVHQKFKIQGDVLNATAHLYLFAEVN